MSRNVWLTAAVMLVALAGARESAGSPVTLTGADGSGVTALVLNDQLIGQVFSFDLENTSSTGFITNLGLAAGDIVDLSSFTTTAPFSYTSLNDPAQPPEFPTGPLEDFALFLPSSGTTGILPGQTFHYALTLAGDSGLPFPDVTADQLSDALQARFRGLSTPSGIDLAVSPVPEPATLTLTSFGLVAALQRYRRRRRA